MASVGVPMWAVGQRAAFRKSGGPTEEQVGSTLEPTSTTWFPSLDLKNEGNNTLWIIHFFVLVSCWFLTFSVKTFLIIKIISEL